MRNVNLSLNHIYAEHMHRAAITALDLMPVAKQDLYDYECDPNSGVLRITANTVARTEFSK